MLFWKKIVPFTMIVLVLSCGAVYFAQADSYGIADTIKATGNSLPTKIGGAGTVPEFIGVIIRVILSSLAVVFFLIIFYAGILWMTARGSAPAIEKAKGMMEAAVIGLVIVMGSYAISRFIFQNLAGNGSVVNTNTVSGAECSAEVNGEFKGGGKCSTNQGCSGTAVPMNDNNPSCPFCCL